MKNYAKNRIDLLEEHIRGSSKKITVNSVNTKSFYSYRHANRLFKSLKGESINSYSNKIRIQTAAEYLKYSSKSIFDIAFDSGYGSTAAFSKAFKKLYGQAPSAFREEYHSSLPSKLTEEFYYTLTYFDALKLHTLKVALDLDISFEGFYEHVKATFDRQDPETHSWMLMWDEDPELTRVAESRYFVVISPDVIISFKKKKKCI